MSNADTATERPPVALTRLLEKLDLSPLENQSESTKATAAFRELLNHTRTAFDDAYRNGWEIRELVQGRAYVIDRIIQAAWQLFNWHAEEQISLLAVGGYGRGELHPHSDIDLLRLNSVAVKR